HSGMQPQAPPSPPSPPPPVPGQEQGQVQGQVQTHVQEPVQQAADDEPAKQTRAPEAAKPSTKSESKSKAAEQDASADEDIAAQMDIMDAIVSNAVLELELQQVPARIQGTRDKGEIAELRDLESAIKLRMSVVAAQVGAGVLTIEDYIAGVEKEIAQNREWALSAKRQGRKDLAVRALKRIKAMQSELDEMKQAMEAGSEE
ncbi:hypothetical protein LPJ75_006876, partial [Coemansia sp. RSA 2598]